MASTPTRQRILGAALDLFNRHGYAATSQASIAAAAGIRAIGLFPTQRPMHPGRWAPLGRDVLVLVDEAHDHLDANAHVHAIDHARVLPLLDPLRPRA